MLKPCCCRRSETLRARPVTVVPLSTATLVWARCAREVAGAAAGDFADCCAAGAEPTELGVLDAGLPLPPPATLTMTMATTTTASMTAAMASRPPRPKRLVALARASPRRERGGIVADGAEAARAGWAGRGGIGGAGVGGCEPGGGAGGVAGGGGRGGGG